MTNRTDKAHDHLQRVCFQPRSRRRLTYDAVAAGAAALIGLRVKGGPPELQADTCHYANEIDVRLRHQEPLFLSPLGGRAPGA